MMTSGGSGLPAIKPVRDGLYSISFCKPNECSAPGVYRPNTTIENDPMYETAFFCDKSMAAFFKSKPLEFDKAYDTVILSRSDEIVGYLESLTR